MHLPPTQTPAYRRRSRGRSTHCRRSGEDPLLVRRERGGGDSAKKVGVERHPRDWARGEIELDDHVPSAGVDALVLRVHELVPSGRRQVLRVVDLFVAQSARALAPRSPFASEARKEKGISRAHLNGLGRFFSSREDATRLFFEMCRMREMAICAPTDIKLRRWGDVLAGASGPRDPSQRELEVALVGVTCR